MFVFVERNIVKEGVGMNNNKFITRNERERNVNQYDYGDIESLGINCYDIPVKAEFCYNESNELIYENYDNLIIYIENNLIPNHIVKKNKYNTNFDSEDSFYYIRLKDILRLKLSEREVIFVINYLGKKNIFVMGFSTVLEGEFDNYICIRTKGIKNVSIELPIYSLSISEEQELFLEYKENPSLELKQRIALSNSRLVSSQAGIYSKLFNIDVDELFGYGMIGLLKSIPLFDLSLGTKFSTFALYRIKREMMRGIYKIKGIPLKDNNDSYFFCKILNEIERTQCSSLDENITLVDDLINALIEKEVIKDGEEKKEHIINWSNIISHLSIEEILFSDSEDTILWDITKDNNAKNYYNGNLAHEIVYDNLFKDDVAKVIDTLDEKRSEILKMRYGLYPYNIPLSLEKIGKIYNVSHERIRQLENQGLKILRGYSKKRILKDYYD